MQQCPVPAALDVVGDVEHEAGGEALPAVLGMDRDRADLGPAVGVEALAGHRDQLPVPSDPYVPSHLVGARLEGPGPGLRDQGEHLVGVGRSELDRLRLGARGEAVGLDELHARDLELRRPAGRQQRIGVGDGDHGIVPEHVEDRIPHVGVLPVAHSHEGGDVLRIAQHVLVADRELAVGAGERGPGGVVEHRMLRARGGVGAPDVGLFVQWHAVSSCGGAGVTGPRYSRRGIGAQLCHSA